MTIKKAKTTDKIRFAIAGTLDYLKEGNEYLAKHGYKPLLVIEGNSNIHEFKREIIDKKIDLLACLAHPNILTKNEIQLFKKGCINLHAGLPRYRGRHPVNWMLIEGLEEIPVSVHFIDEGIDTGDIITHDTIVVEREDDYHTIMRKITELEQRLLYYAIKQIETGTVYRRRQHKSLLKYTRKRVPEDSAIDWNMKSVDLHNHIRALVDPMPNAFAYTTSGKRVRFKKSWNGSASGIVVAETVDGQYAISTADGIILVELDKKIKVGEKFKASI